MPKSPSEDQILSKLIRALSAGEYLFRQGDLGNTMFLVLDGEVHLYHQTNRTERLVWSLGPGEMLGEKAIFGNAPYRRTVTAQAKTPVSVIEFDNQNLKIIQSRFPDFTAKMIKMLSERLDNANELISILQSREDSTRVMEYLVFYAKLHGQKKNESIELAISVDSIGSAVNVSSDSVSEVLEKLEEEKLVTFNKKTEIITISDIQVLQDSINAIVTTLAA